MLKSTRKIGCVSGRAKHINNICASLCLSGPIQGLRAKSHLSVCLCLKEIKNIPYLHSYFLRTIYLQLWLNFGQAKFSHIWMRQNAHWKLWRNCYAYFCKIITKKLSNLRLSTKSQHRSIWSSENRQTWYPFKILLRWRSNMR